ncbi:MAG: hypothetical protein FWD45_02755, partial [Coriobacteriia bacterium]|nr:hypothetical protein [Coriobacteriia bacterium]
MTVSLGWADPIDFDSEVIDSSYGEDYPTDAVILDDPSADCMTDERADVFIVAEDESLRSESAKHFRLSDGSYTVADYGIPVHIEGSDGSFT